ncbi:MAG: DUF4351 domain-containing protein [Nostoc sp. JL34]|nr:DUF4351 domain-containing protein [Nostoc sp. JL34]
MLGITLQQTRVYREIKEEGREAMANAISRQLTKRLGKLSEEMRSSFSGLSLPVLADLSEALLDFTSLTDLYQVRLITFMITASVQKSGKPLSPCSLPPAPLRSK